MARGKWRGENGEGKLAEGKLSYIPQHAFRSSKGTDTALSEAVNKIESGLLRQEYTLGVFLDISGAFNNLSFKSAIKSMRKRKFPTKIINWYKYFLTNQESTMELDNNFYTRALTRGTPQGGVLSPLIWNVNFDSILEELNKGPIKVIGFVDDAAILITGIDPKTMDWLLIKAKRSQCSLPTDKTKVAPIPELK
jgi:retron-type reverse transcriptase